MKNNNKKLLSLNLETIKNLDDVVGGSRHRHHPKLSAGVGCEKSGIVSCSLSSMFHGK